jgi:hypothetical protein
MASPFPSNTRPVAANGQPLVPTQVTATTLPAPTAPRPYFAPARPTASPLFQTGQPVYSQPGQAPQQRRRRQVATAPVVPASLKDATAMGLKEAGLSLKQTAQGAASVILPGPLRDKFEKDRQATAAERDALDSARDRYYGGEGAGGIGKEALARLPGNLIKTAPEMLNPFKKAAMLNTGYHAVRSFVQNKDPLQAGLALVGNVAGEKSEALFRNLPGNAAGSVIEKTATDLMSKGSEAAAEQTINLATSTQPSKPPPRPAFQTLPVAQMPGLVIPR